MKHETRIALACAIALYGLSAQAADTPIGVPQDWSSRAVIHRQPMLPEEFEASGRKAEMAAKYRDPRYVASVLRRVESEARPLPLVQRGGLAQALTAQGSSKQQASSRDCKDRRRGQCPDTPTTPDPEVSGSALRDWSNVLGGGVNGQGGSGAQGIFPAKYNLDIFAPPSCTNDFVVYTTNAAGATQSGARHEQWSADITAQPTNGQTITIGLAGRRQVQLTASSGSNTARNFQTSATNSVTAQNLRDAINRWTGETGFRAEGSGATVTIISNTAGDIDGGSIDEGLSGYSPANTLPGSGTTTPGQPTVVAFNQLYNTTCNAGRANANAPNVMWAYNTGTNYIAETSPVLSYLDGGKQIAFVQRSGNSLQLVLLKPGSGSGTATNPATPVFKTNADYRGCNDAVGCYTTISFSTAAGANNNSAGGATWSSPFVDYATDTLWAGDGNGILHKFTGVFQTTPGEVTSGGFPRVVDAGMKLSPPVYAGGSVYIGSQSGSGTLGGKLHRVDAATGALFSSAKLAVADSTGIREAVIVDNFTGSLFAFLFNDGTAGNTTDCAPTDPGVGNFDACRVVARFGAGFANNAAPLQRAYVGRGNSRVSALYAGAFDDDYYNSTDASGAMYIVGGRPDNTYYPTLWKIPLVAGAMQAPVRGAEVGNNIGCGAQPNCSNGIYDMSPVNVIKNPHTELEYLFFSMPKDATAAGCTGACLYMYPLNQFVAGTPGSSETWTFDIRRNSGNGFTSNGNFVVGSTTLTSPANFSIAGDRPADRSALVTAINAVSGTTGYTANATGTCPTSSGGTACTFVVTRTAPGNVPASNVTSTLDYRGTSNANGVDPVTAGVQDIAWGTGNTPGAALPVPGGTGGILIDNVRPTSETGTSQIYFAQLDTAVLKRWEMRFVSNATSGAFTVNGVTFNAGASTSCTSTGGTFNVSGDRVSDADALRTCLRQANLPGFSIAGENNAGAGATSTAGSVSVTYSIKGNPADTVVTESIDGTSNAITITQGTVSTAGNAIQVSQSALQ